MNEGSLQVSSDRLVVYRNSPFGIDAKSGIGKPAIYTGRFHRKGEPLPLYCADSYTAALGEHELHTAEPLQPTREVLRRVSLLAVAAGTTLLTGDHVDTLEAAGVTLEEVYHPTDYTACHRLIDLARALPGVIGVSTQSNAERHQRTIVILPDHVHQMTDVSDYWEGSLNLLKKASHVMEMTTQSSG